MSSATSYSEFCSVRSVEEGMPPTSDTLQQVKASGSFLYRRIYTFRTMAQQPPVGQDFLIIEALRSHSE